MTAFYILFSIYLTAIITHALTRARFERQHKPYTEKVLYQVKHLQTFDIKAEIEVERPRFFENSDLPYLIERATRQLEKDMFSKVGQYIQCRHIELYNGNHLLMGMIRVVEPEPLQ